SMMQLTAPEVPTDGGTADFALSFAQERLWFLDRYEPGCHAFNVPVVLRLSGPLNIDALEASLAEILRRHEVLRTRFPSRDGRPYQEVLPLPDFVLPVDTVAAPPGS